MRGVFQFDFVVLKDGYRHLLTASSDFCCRPCFDAFGKSGSRHEAAQLVKSRWRSVAVWRRALSEGVRSIGHSSFDIVTAQPQARADVKRMLSHCVVLSVCGFMLWCEQARGTSVRCRLKCDLKSLCFISRGIPGMPGLYCFLKQI